MVAPSGSCAGMLKLHYPELLAGDPTWKRAGRGVRGQGARAHLLPGQRARRRGRRCRARRRAPPTTTAARACASSACSEQPRKLLRSVKGLELVELADADVCCGFGGTFSVKYPDISNAIVERKAEHDRRDRRRPAAGRRSRLPDEHGGQALPAGPQRSPCATWPRCWPASSRDPRDRRAPHEHRSPRRPSRPTRAPRSATSSCSGRCRRCRAGLAARRGAARAGLPEFEALRDLGRDIKDHTLAHLDLYLEEFESKAGDAGSHACISRRRPRMRAAIVREICRDAGARVVTKGKSMISEEIGLNAAWRRTASRWSRPISANT